MYFVLWCTWVYVVCTRTGGERVPVHGVRGVSLHQRVQQHLRGQVAPLTLARVAEQLLQGRHLTLNNCTILYSTYLLIHKSWWSLTQNWISIHQYRNFYYDFWFSPYVQKGICGLTVEIQLKIPYISSSIPACYKTTKYLIRYLN